MGKKKELLIDNAKLMEEWDWEENDKNNLNPSLLSSGSNTKANWICAKGHKYTKSIYRRAKMGKGCKICNQGRSTSYPEQCFFFYTKKLFPDAINRYKDIFSNQMELDIYIPSIRTGVEYDGIYWHGKNAVPREEKKYRICRSHGIRLFRIKEGDFNGFHDTADRTWYIPKRCSSQILNDYITEYLKLINVFGKNLPLVNVEEDKNEILEFKELKYEESLAYLFPDIANDWHHTKNGKLSPDSFVPGSAEVVWWECKACGNEWRASIVNRTKGHGCNKCATEVRKITKKQSILNSRGCLDNELCLLDWDYEENEHGPEFYTNGSGELVNWKCHICGYKWRAAICDRTRDYRSGCACCSGKVIVPGHNDLPTMRPVLMEEWNYEKNLSLDPIKVGVGSHEYAWWICKKCGYNWPAQIYNRANGKGCPCCANRVVVPGINDLATTDPVLAKEWHPTLNEKKATEVSRGQALMGFWQCSQCGNIWQDTLNHRSR